jgi:glycosyltransferase involved in cell wall biosynthesis
MKQTWIDLTDMIVWRGHFTGIQRVVYSYASRFNAEGARFFVYDSIDGRHVEVDFSFLDRTTDTVEPVAPTRRRRIKQSLGRPYYSLSDERKAALRPFVDIANNTVRTAISRFVNDEPVSGFRDYETADFTRNDKVVLLGAGWNEAGSLSRLCELRQEKGIKIIQHINDILPIYQPHLFADELPKSFTPYVDLAVRNADAITVISEATKRDLEIFCKEKKVKTPPIKVVRLGEDVQAQEAKKPSTPLPESFILSLGTFEIRKNYILLYQAAKLAQLEGKDFPAIVIVGRKGWLTEDLSHVIRHDPYTKDRIIWLDGVSDTELEWLYERCMFTVFPSLCEGWGLPIVEALQHGKTCLTSNVSAMLEIGDGLIDYFSPYDSRACMDKILQYAPKEVHGLANDNVKKGYKVFSWDESFKDFSAAVDSTT